MNDRELARFVYENSSEPNIKNPVFVRYAWSDTSTASLFNSEGLPASSFSTQN